MIHHELPRSIQRLGVCVDALVYLLPEPARIYVLHLQGPGDLNSMQNPWISRLTPYLIEGTAVHLCYAAG